MLYRVILAIAGLGCSRAVDAVLSTNVTASPYIPANFSAPVLRQDNGSYGPPLEVSHYFYNQWPIGLAIHAPSGRQFVCYTRGTDNYTVGVVTGPTTEAAYPNVSINSPPGGLANMTLNPVAGSDLSNYFISVQALYITDNTLWVLDTGRPTINSSVVYASVGGPKLVSINLDTNQVTRTYTFPATVHYPDSYLNDVRFDLRNTSQVAYLVDSSDEGRNGFIILDLVTGQSWRRLSQHPSVLRAYNAIASYFGQPFYQVTQGYDGNVVPNSLGHLQEGLDGVAISPDGEYLYYGALTSDDLYRISTSTLRARPSFLADQAASNAVEFIGQKGGQANGHESDSNGLIYMSIPEHNAIYYYDPSDLQVHGFVQDPRILWADSLSVASDGYIYFTINQLPFQPEWNNGTDKRTYPGVIFRAQLPNGGTKITTLG